MANELSQIYRAFHATITRPDDVARMILARTFSRDTLWSALLLSVVLSTLVIGLERWTGHIPRNTLPLSGTPFADVAVLGSITVMMVFVLYYAGLSLGGTGTFAGTLALMTWFQFVVLLLLVAQLALSYINVALGAFFTLFSFAAQMWVLVNFLDVLHGFASRGKAVLLLFLSFIGLALGLVVIVLLIGSVTMIGDIS